MDEFKSLRVREKEEENCGRIGPEDLEGGFQLVYGKKEKGGARDYEKDSGVSASGAAVRVKMASRDKKTTAACSKVPFHIPKIPRPQQEFNILVDNLNRPFEHVWLERSVAGSHVVHPLEKLSVLEFVDRNVGEGDPVKPLPVESTPFKLVAGVKELKELAAKLRDVKEFAVYKRSYEVCMQLYEKELLTDTSYLYINGLQEADFNSKQLAIVSGLCEWRDKIAREEDESTGYILPNKALLEIARQMPLSSGKLRRLVKSKHPYVERHLHSVIGILRSSIENSSLFESISEQLKKGCLKEPCKI